MHIAVDFSPFKEMEFSTLDSSPPEQSQLSCRGTRIALALPLSNRLHRQIKSRNSPCPRPVRISFLAINKGTVLIDN